MTTDILVLNGSPRRESESAFLAERIAGAAGYAFESAALYTRRIRPCTACLACAETGRCVLDDDDMGALRRRIHEARGLIVASPLHFTSLSAPVVALFSRLEPDWLAYNASAGRTAPRPHAGAAALAVAGGSDRRGMFEPARRVAAAAFATLRRVNLGVAAAANTEAVAVRENRIALGQAERIGGALRITLDGMRG
ncbi:MAG: flavodoxin family protein [Planctomycetota bacterium]|nr:flavodoxin family protein [Planctomycetota bacterium]